MRRSLTLVAVAVATAGAAMAALPTAAMAESAAYCDEIVPAKTDCAVNPGHPWDWANGFFEFNQAEYPGSGSVSVCEHTYDRSNGSTVSDRCKTNFITSESDLSFYWEHHIELSGHAGNNSSVNHTINGAVY